MVAADTPFVRLSALRGRQVVTEAGAAELQVRDVALADDGRTVARVLLSRPALLSSREAGSIPIDAVEQIGPDAVVVRDEDPSPDDGDAERSGMGVVGKAVITDEGVELGSVLDLVLRTYRGKVRVEALELRTVDGERYVVLGKEPTLLADVVLLHDHGADDVLASPDDVAEAISG